jgi:hypothetical protein
MAFSASKWKLPVSDTDEEFSDFSFGSSGNYIPDEAEASSPSEVRNYCDVILWHRSTWMQHIHLVTCNES